MSMRGFEKAPNNIPFLQPHHNSKQQHYKLITTITTASCVLKPLQVWERRRLLEEKKKEEEKKEEKDIEFNQNVKAEKVPESESVQPHLEDSGEEKEELGQ